MRDKYHDAVCYLDTNIFVYMHDSSDPEKKVTSDGLYKHFMKTKKGRISVQVISEWRNVMVRKYAHIVSSEMRRRFIRYLKVWKPLVTTPDIILRADRLCDLYNFSAYDSIHIQCALEQNCRYFLSEDMQDGLMINDMLTICNPYKKEIG